MEIGVDARVVGVVEEQNLAIAAEERLHGIASVAQDPHGLRVRKLVGQYAR